MFTAYATGPESVVLMGNIDTDPTPAMLLPAPLPHGQQVPQTPPVLPFQHQLHHPPFTPTIHPDLQSPINSIISVVLGDYHFGCLTSSGKLLTWGQFSKGALGLGDPLDLEVGQPGGFQTEQDKNVARSAADRGYLPVEPRAVDEPVEVMFDWEERKKKGEAEGKKEKYCFAATAAGWHTGALVIDLEVRIFYHVLSFTSLCQL